MYTEKLFQIRPTKECGIIVIEQFQMLNIIRPSDVSREGLKFHP